MVRLKKVIFKAKSLYIKKDIVVKKRVKMEKVFIAVILRLVQVVRR
jgi:hypothetical protein